MSSIKKITEDENVLKDEDLFKTIISNEEIFPKIITAYNVSKNELYFYLLIKICLENNDFIDTIKETIKIEPNSFEELVFNAVKGTHYLCFENEKIGDTGIENIVKYFKSLTNITHINFKNCGVGDNGAKVLFDNLQLLPNLFQLDIDSIYYK